MKAAVLSDCHDNVPVMEQAVARATELGAEVILFAGDMVAPFTAKKLATFEGPVVAVFGNNDGERKGLSTVLDRIEDPPVEVDLGGCHVVMVHDLSHLDASRRHDESIDVIVHGHTHDLQHTGSNPMLLNPGELGGWLTGRRTFCLLDTDTLAVDVIDL